ncbi:hypothetical protein FM104_13830 [Microbacterium esteraromaticum]|uniref:Uncharacterized protein n=1 Tax=Microbacterium esteraromaticum TaxID=57043 RepID=A0A1R4KM62_9MICO|nr:hypothetical protein FM104_13830 [Microbacterium esteraromaticum]
MSSRAEAPVAVMRTGRLTSAGSILQNRPALDNEPVPGDG